jgi:lactoylglutathione lyase
MDLAWCDVCLRVKTALESRKFYASLGFQRVEGNDQEGWAVVTNGQLRLGLFEPTFMKEPITLNFRGGDIAKIASELKSLGHTFESGPKFAPAGGGTATMRDPDGFAITFDCAPGELMTTEPIPEN